MLSHRPARLLITCAGLGVLFFLAAAQFGLLVGWCNTNSALIRNAGVDVWVMAERTPAFDYGTAIPRGRLYQVRTVEGVGWAEGLFMAWNVWQRKDGRRVNVELVGLDDSSVGGPWDMKVGSAEDVHLPDSVIVDELYLSLLQVQEPGDEAEMFGRRVVVRGVSRGVRTFTASPFIFTSIRSAIKYDKRYAPDEITYVMVRCAEGHSPTRLAAAIREAVPHVEVLTTDEFVVRTVKYWMLETGVGITVVLTAVLGVLVSVFVTSQTLFNVTQEHLGNYATLLALGFSRSQVVACVLFQSLLFGGCGVLIGSLLFWLASGVSARTPISLETTPAVYLGLVLASLLASMGSSVISLRAVFSIDPVTVFRG
jgi:putative ABC transport system permease protein